MAVLPGKDRFTTLVAVATWTNEILLYTVAQLHTGSDIFTSPEHCALLDAVPKTPTRIPVPHVASSLLFREGAQLMAGLSDGTMVTYDLELLAQDAPEVKDRGQVVVKGRKASSLGSRPLSLCPTPGMTVGDDSVVAVGLTERMSVVFQSKDRLDFSSVSYKVSPLKRPWLTFRT